jgi:transposase-like protein
MGGRWYVASSLRTRQGAARRAARGVEVEHAPLPGGPHSAPAGGGSLAAPAAAGGGRWRLAETSRTGTGTWYSLSGAVAQHGPPLAWLLTAPRAPEVVRRLLQKASRRPGRHETLPIDGSDATDAASKRSHEAPGPASAIRPGQDGKQVVAQEQRAGQRVPRPRGGYIRCGRPGHVRWSRPHAHDQEPTAGG